MADKTAAAAAAGSTVRQVIGANIQRIRKVRGLKGEELVSRLRAHGIQIPASSLSEIETGKRRVSAEELLVFAIALNTSVIDLLTPLDGSPLTVAEGVEPLHPAWLEDWLRGETSWPATGDQATQDEFFSTASDERKLRYRTGMRPELQEIAALKSAVTGAIDGPSDFNQIGDPELMAEYLRTCLDRVDAYVKLLADRIEKNGYGAR